MSSRRGPRQARQADVSAATRHWTRSALDERAVADGCWFDAEAAERVRDFASLCKQSKGRWAGQPIELIPWQWEQIVAPLFGWKRADGTRRYRLAYVEVPKKNGKSTLMSYIELYLLLGDGEPAAEVYTAAADRDQAGIIHDEAERMVTSSPALSRRLICTTSRKRIVHPASGSKLVALSADAPTKEGLNASAVIFDELHAQRTPTLWDTLRYSGAARRQPLLLSITTAGWDRNSICWEQHEIAQRVLDGTYPAWDFLAVIYGATEEDDWRSPEVWRRVNPSLGVTITEEDLASQAAEAAASPRKLNSFLRYRLNVWTQQDQRWLDMDAWDRCSTAWPDLAGRDCWVGLDLSTKIDVTAAVLLFPVDDLVYVLPRFFVPREGLREREERDAVPYTQWVREGHCEATSGNVIDYGAVREQIRRWNQMYTIREVAYDPFAATQLALQLQDEDGLSCVEVPQSIKHLSEPAKELESLVVSNRLRHDGNPVLRWMAASAAIIEDNNGNIRPSKKHSTQRIDGIAATVTALARMLATRGDGKSIYETRGLVTL